VKKLHHMMTLAVEKTAISAPAAKLYRSLSTLQAAISIPANLAEGHCRRTTKAYANHVSIAIGSHGELETYLELSCRLGFLSVEDRARILAISDSVGRLLNGLYRVLVTKVCEP